MKTKKFPTHLKKRLNKNKITKSAKEAQDELKSMNNLITIQETYHCMILFLEKYYQRTQSDDIGSLLGDLQLTKEEESFDPAALEEWKKCLKKAQEQ